MPFVPGYDTAITINSTDLTLYGQTTEYTVQSTLLPKPTFGTEWRNTIKGQKVVALSVSGHVDESLVPQLQAIDDAATVTFIIQIGTAGGASDGGQYTGTAVVGEYALTADAEGQWSWTLDLETTGPAVYTPAGP